MFAFLIEFFTEVISNAGYVGLALLMMLESMIAPVPSEAVMPFAGFLIYQAKMTWGAVIFFSTLGSIIGSLVSYYIGKNYGRPLIIKYGKYLLLKEHHLDLTEKFFKKFGQKTIFFSRFIPIVRHFISLPAGAARMNIWVFSLYTILGAAMWNSFLTYLGYRLGSNWEVIRTYSEKLDIIVVVLIIIGVGYLFYKKKKNIKKDA
ncbi:MAG: DedA family protein [Candidatus Paceibacterota bacterium]